MIPLALTHALALYSAVLGLLIAAIWLYTELTVRRRRRFLTKQFLWRCVFCSYTYLDESAERISRCPRCASLNSVEDKAARFVPAKTPRAKRAQKPAASVQGQRNPSRRKRPHQTRRGPKRRR